MAETFELEIVTPDKMVLKDVAEQMQIPGKNGYLGILPGHAPLITELAIGEISYTAHGATNYLAVAWGFAEVLPNKVTILAESAEKPEEIDTGRAQEAKKRAEERLQHAGAELDYQRALSAVRRAEVRLQVAGHTTANTGGSH
ncbi:MAG TPA: F0F1 ATP synthase subunit epsilon [Candidatus Koribacter sp.]|jgi:F-type H+-transporting ATPase subunit epsilon